MSELIVSKDSDSALKIELQDSLTIANVELAKKELLAAIKFDKDVSVSSEKELNFDLAALQLFIGLKKDLDKNNFEFDFEVSINDELKELLQITGVLF